MSAEKRGLRAFGPQQGKFVLPKDHSPGLRVPKGGSCCANCEYLLPSGKECGNEHFQEWHGSKRLPAPADEYCSDWWEGK